MDTYDVIVVGAGPAGTTAALALAAAEAKVAVVDAADFPRARPCTGWVNIQTADLLNDVGAKPPRGMLESVEEIFFSNGDFTRSARPRQQSSRAYVIDRQQFDTALVDAARKAGVEVLENFRVNNMTAHEDRVEVQAGEDQLVTGKFLVMACGPSRKLLDQVGLPMPSSSAPIRSFHLEAEPDKKAKKKSTRITVILAATQRQGFAVLVDQGDRIALTFDSAGDADELTPRFVELTKALVEREMAPKEFLAASTKTKPIDICHFSALEMDSHVGKRSLIVGDAGGFQAAASHEGIYPAMWSARIAAQCIGEALKSKVPQDALMKFDTKWRLEMGEFLRAPNTDLQLLLPLIFTNQSMADRMAAAFFGGDNI